MAHFISTQAQLIITARAQGYFTSNTRLERTLLCPQCKVKQGILFHKNGKPDVLACPCGTRRVMGATTGVEMVAEDDPRANPVPAAPAPKKDDRCMGRTKRGKRCSRKAGPSGYCSIPAHRPGNSAV